MAFPGLIAPVGTCGAGAGNSRSQGANESVQHIVLTGPLCIRPRRSCVRNTNTLKSPADLRRGQCTRLLSARISNIATSTHPFRCRSACSLQYPAALPKVWRWSWPAGNSPPAGSTSIISLLDSIALQFLRPAASTKRGIQGKRFKADRDHECLLKPLGI